MKTFSVSAQSDALFTDRSSGFFGGQAREAFAAGLKFCVGRAFFIRANVLAAAVATCCLPAQAVEGMWVPQQLPEIAGPLAEAGLKLPPEQLADLTGDPLGAVVSLGGCTGSFVSPQGLVATNHHCAYGAIQLNSTPERNLMEDGFSPKSLEEEVSAGPSARIFVLDEIVDVTEQARKVIAEGKTPLARKQALEALEKKLIADCEASGVHSCRLFSFFDGLTFRLFKNLEIRDVRLAYAPPNAIGSYGGEVDNFMWPRHTADFSLYRAYVGPDGKPAPYHKDNVPYKPRHWLKLADKPLAEGDFIMIAGYPGSTHRNMLLDEYTHTAEWDYPENARHYKNVIDMVEAAGKDNPDIDVAYASIKRRWANRMKNFNGQLQGFKDSDVDSIKAREEKAVLAWLQEQGEKGKAALQAHARMQEMNRDYYAKRERNLVLVEVGGALGNTANTLYRLALEREKPDNERESGYQERDVAKIEGNIKQMEKRYLPEMDRQLQRYWLMEYIKLPEDQRVAPIDQWLGGHDEAAVDRALDRLAQSKLRDGEERLKWLKADRAAFEASDDPAIQYAVGVVPALIAMQEEEKARAGELLEVRPLYMQALIDYRAAQGQAIYPDANQSLRLTFGKVTGYTKLDGSVQTPFTVAEQIPEKDTGKAPLNAPKNLLDAIAAKKYAGFEDEKLGTLPVNFLSDLDITGGNSGSPIMDAEGKLVGLAFDGTWESVSSKWIFDPALTRVIGVDQRYIRWIMQEIYPAPRLLEEMGAK